jgi:hypothetical protein
MWLRANYLIVSVSHIENGNNNSFSSDGYRIKRLNAYFET